MTSPAVHPSRNACLTSRNSVHTPPSRSCPRAAAVVSAALDNSSRATRGFRGRRRQRVHFAHLPRSLPRVPLWRQARFITLLVFRSASSIDCASIGILSSLLSFPVVLQRCSPARKSPQLVGYRVYAHCFAAHVVSSVPSRVPVMVTHRLVHHQAVA
jgi:hypothetical protein